jgi:hypothetical protein
MSIGFYTRYSFLYLVILFFSCNPFNEAKYDKDISEFELEDGLTIECIAKEPLVESPVNMVFDENGSAWVIEMKSYMSDIDGLNEENPISRIKKLEDSNGDGKYDRFEIFLDSLILPRSVLPVYGGVLVAIPPALWHYDKDGKTRELVDSSYAVGGNVEHQANGLLKGIDNWIYSAKSDRRYRKIKGKWIIENTKFRGQWGIDQDDYGRLYYNHNSILLQTELFPPNTIGRFAQTFYPNIKKEIPNTENNDRLFPAQETKGVNRAYEEGMLDSLNRLKFCTSCCGVSVLGSNGLGKEYKNNFFVAETSVNLVKRLVIQHQEDGLQKIENPYTESEFLRSKSELFRPVYTTTGNDGNLYIVDMRKGVIQHVTYLTNYLRKYVTEKRLDTIVNQGRIYRVSKKYNSSQNFNINQYSDEELVQLLTHENRIIRTHAQWKIVTENKVNLLPQLVNLFKDANDSYTKIHLLYALEGLQQLNEDILKSAISDKNVHVRRLGIFLNMHYGYTNFVSYESLAKYDQFVYLSGMAGGITASQIKTPKFSSTLKQIANDSLLSAIFSGKLWETKDEQIINETAKLVSDTNSIIYQFLSTNPNAPDKPNLAIEHLSRNEKDLYFEGEWMYKKLCVSCHNVDGKGFPTLAPPLVGSAIVNNSEISVPIRMVLYGKTLNKGEVSPYGASMTGLVDNESVNNGNIAGIITYIRNSWGNKSTVVTLENVSKERKLGR